MADANVNIDIKAQGGAQTQAEISGVGEKLTGLAKVGSEVRGLFTKLLGPLAIAGGIVQFANSIAEARAEADRLRATVNESLADFAAGALSRSVEPLSGVDARIDNEKARLTAQLTELQKEADKRIASLPSSPAGLLRRAIFGGDTREDIQRDIEQSSEFAIKLSNKAIERLEEQRRAAQTRIAEQQQQEALDRERADDEREAKLRQAAEDQQREGLNNQKELEKAQLETAAKVAEAMRKAILEPLEAIRRANEQFLNTQNGNLITSIDRLRATLEATGGSGRFDGAETGFVD